jgi:hypothetical protein
MLAASVGQMAIFLKRWVEKHQVKKKGWSASPGGKAA